MRTMRIGACHCGTVRFEVDLDEDAIPLNRCNCSLCRRRGAVMTSVPLDRFRLLAGAETLSLYRWNSGVAKHYFCSRCGIYTHHQRRSAPEQYAVNVACLVGGDLSLGRKVGELDGASNSLVGVAQDPPPATVPGKAIT